MHLTPENLQETISALPNLSQLKQRTDIVIKKEQYNNGMKNLDNPCIYLQISILK